MVARAAGQPLAALVWDRLWGPFGAEHDASFLLDRAGREIAGAGFGATLATSSASPACCWTAARVGRTQVMPADAMARMGQGGCRTAFAAAGQPTRPGWSYRSQWCGTHDAHDSWCALGVFGQRI
jgi:CubicO group peptidase (beta-lactamase class C family)